MIISLMIMRYKNLEVKVRSEDLLLDSPCKKSNMGKILEVNF